MKVASFLKRLDEVALGGQERGPDSWPWDSSHLRQDWAERGDPQNRWPRGTDHTDRRGRGIAERSRVQQRVWDSLSQALIDTY